MKTKRDSLDLKNCQKTLRIKFKKKDWLVQALTHDSYVASNPEDLIFSNERLEFLGDSILGMLISHELFQAFPELPEGELTQMKSNLINSAFLAEKARQIGLGEFIRLGVEDSKARNNTTILADCFEALLGAIYQDRGFKEVKNFILRIFTPEIENLEGGVKDPKSLLQEIIQRNYKVLPHYKVMKEKGPAHQKIFAVSVYLGEQKLGSGEGKSKRQAQQKAAEMALEKIQPKFEKDMIKTIITVKVKPRSAKNEIKIKGRGDLEVKITQPPVEGKANQALVKLLSNVLDIPQSKINILKGEKSRDKIVEIDDLHWEEISLRLGSGE